MTSFTWNFTLSRAGIIPHTAPARNPAKNMAGRSQGSGRPENRATPVAATAPARICPSAPMFQNWARKATTSPTPHRMSGIARRTTSAHPWGLWSVPWKMTR